MAADPPAAGSGPKDDPPTRVQRWLARLSFVLAAAAAAIVPIFAGLKSLAMLAAVVVSLLCGYLFLAAAGLLRWLSLAVFILAPAALVVRRPSRLAGPLRARRRSGRRSRRRRRRPWGRDPG